jgi:aspartate kinase
VIVLKFGGTSVRNAEWMKRSLAIVMAQLGRAPIVVLSATAKTTDRLVALANAARNGDQETSISMLSEIEKSHREAAQALVTHDAGENLLEKIDSLLGELRSIINGMMLIRECTPRTYDTVLSYGELLSTTIFSAAAIDNEIETVLLDSRNLVRTDSAFTKAQPEMEITSQLIRDAVTPRPGRLYVAQGFIGSTQDGVTTTLGRGGSDYTATLYGKALGAEEVQIWTDVDGIMTCDPRIVASARTVPVISYDEAAELAVFGAKVVHPATILPATGAGIPVLVKNTGRPEHEGTCIRQDSGTKGVQALAGKRGVTVVTVNSSRMLNAFGFLRKIFGVFEAHAIPVDLVATSEVSVSSTIDSDADTSGLKHDLEAYGTVTVETDKAILCLVGRDLWKESAFVARVFSTLRDVRVRMISLGASDTNLSLVLSEDDLDFALNRLHQEFFPEMDGERS